MIILEIQSQVDALDGAQKEVMQEMIRGFVLEFALLLLLLIIIQEDVLQFALQINIHMEILSVIHVLEFAHQDFGLKIQPSFVFLCALLMLI
jgi:hypothetical protein